MITVKVVNHINTFFGGYFINFIKICGEKPTLWHLNASIKIQNQFKTVIKDCFLTFFTFDQILYFYSDSCHCCLFPALFFHSKGRLTFCRVDMYWKHSWPWRPPMGLRCYPIVEILGWNRAKPSLGWLLCPPEEQSILGNKYEGKSHKLCCKQQGVCGPHGNTSMLFVCNYDNCNLILKPPVDHLLFR